MTAEVQLAVAGSGKTTELAQRIQDQHENVRSAALTYTINAQTEITSRLSTRLQSPHETMGWFAFLVRHIVRPYLPKVFPGIYASGLCFVQSNNEIPRWRSGWRYYFNDQQQPFSSRLGQLANKVLVANDSAPIRRLEKIFDRIYIDEFQDLNGNDLEIIDSLMRSTIELFITGDVRQAVIETSRSDRLNRAYRGVSKIDWFREREAAGLCRIVPNNTTRRFNQTIACLSDLIHDPALNLPSTISAQTEVSGHDGVFIVDDEDLDAYYSSFASSPTLLRQRTNSTVLPNAEILSFGSSKGITRDHVIILTTKPIRKWLTTRALLAPSSASGFYVAVTRARYSTALVTPRAQQLFAALHPDFENLVELWTP